MSSLEIKIRELGQKSDTKGLQECLSSVSVDELLNLIQEKLSSSNFIYTWTYILKGLTQNTDSQKKRFQVILKVVRDLEKSELSSLHCNPLIDKICIELRKLRAEDVIKLCNFYIECLQSQRSSQMSWKELMPELLSFISGRRYIEYNDEEVTGIECKHQIINAMCSLQWFPSNVTSLAKMFTDIPLTKEQHLQVVNKLAKYLEKLTPQEIPSFIYQLLRLCKHYNGRIIFAKLQHYFNLRYKDTLRNQIDRNSDSTEFDLIEDCSVQDTVEAEATILFHIHTLASSAQGCGIKDYLRFLKNMLRSPEYIIHPFQLNVLMTISTVALYEESVFEIVRFCISRSFHEEQKKNNSAWFREMMPAISQVETVFGQVINISAQNRDLVLQGLVNFAFILLGVGSALGRDPIAEKQWQLGNMILFKVIKRKRFTAPIIIKRVINGILAQKATTQYIECLYMLSKHLTLLMLENKSALISLMERLIEMPRKNANQVLDAIIPLTKVSPTIRDHLIILLRKALNSRVTQARQVAVTGFLKLLTNLKISNLAAVSQAGSSSSFSSGHSFFTQMSMTGVSHCAVSTFSNEALCLEVLGILKRCFMQPAVVRVQLYAGLHEAVCLNPELGIPVLETIWSHFCIFYNEEDLPPLKFGKIMFTRNVNVTLQEPIGQLIYTIGLIVTKVAKIGSEDKNIVVKFTNTLESMCSRMINCELVHFELDDGTDLTDITAEAQRKVIILKEAMHVYEALIGYKFLSWELESENNGKEINSLFQAYSRFSHFYKNIHKPKKADKRKKDVNKTTQQSGNNTTLKNDGQKLTKTRLIYDYNVLNFPVIIKIMNLLHEPMVSWTTINQANIIKTKKEFHLHMMQTTLNLVSSVKNKKIIEVQVAKTTFAHLRDIAGILYERIIKRFVEFIDFDCTTAVLAVEIFLLILNIVNNQYRTNFQAFLSHIGGKDSNEELTVHLTEFIEVYQKLFEIDHDEISEDPEIKKLSLLIVNTLRFFAQQIPISNHILAMQMMDWLKNFAVSNCIKNNQVANGFVSLLLDCHTKFKLSLTLLEHLSVHIGEITGVINEEEHEIEEFKVINEINVNSIFLSLSKNIKTVLENIEWIIVRLKAEYSMIYPGEEASDRRREELNKRERSICCQLCFIVTIMTNLTNCSVPIGNLSEAVLKNLSLLYNTISSLTKYFIMRSSKINPAFENARFDRLVKLAGKQLPPVVYTFITYIEESQKVPESPRKSKRNVDNSTLKCKILKETRLIPKVVYEIEQFNKFVTQLSKKTNINLSRYLGPGVVRDYRILHLHEVLKKANDGVLEQRTQESDTSILESDEDGTASPPPSKKRQLNVTRK